MNIKTIGFTFALVLAVLMSFNFTENNDVEKGTEKITWMTFEEAVAANKIEKKKLLIDVYTQWCGWCKKMDANTFAKPSVAKMVNEHFYAVKFDAEQKKDIVFDGKTFKYVAQGRRGYHELAAALLNNKMSYPSITYLDEDLNLLTVDPGYKSVEQIIPVLDFLGNDIFKEKSFQEYMEEK